MVSSKRTINPDRTFSAENTGKCKNARRNNQIIIPREEDAVFPAYLS